jgi:hypothetical protein
VTIEDIEQSIKRTYEFFAEAAPGVVVQEQGRLAQLWALADRAYAKDAETLTDAEIIAEFGYLTLSEVR